MKTVVVAGCARSGLTLTMQLLYYGGYPCFGPPPAFEDYEVGKIDWKEANGKAVKVIDTQIQWPPTGDYVVILAKRNFVEQSKSTLKFIRAMGVNVPKTSPKLAKSIAKDWSTIEAWGKRQSKFMIVDFADLLSKPSDILVKFSNLIEFELRPQATQCVIPRGPECHKELLEIAMVKDFEKKQTDGNNS